MTRLDWLKKKHKELDTSIVALENQRTVIRSAEHKATLLDLKKQKLAVKTELEELSKSLIVEH